MREDEGEVLMRQRSRAFIGVIGIAAAVAAAVALALAGQGRAASGNICNVPTIGTAPSLTASSCVTETTAPHFVSAGQSAISVTKFFNQSGQSGATATHVVVAVNFPAAVTVSAIRLTINNVSANTTGCTTANSSVSCPVGNIAGGGVVRLSVQFTPVSSLSCDLNNPSTDTCLYGTANYGEGGGNPSNVPNDFQVGYDTQSLTFGGTGVDGGCFALAPSGLAHVKGGNSAQSTSASVGQGAGDFPCTFADAGVDPKVPAGLSTQVSFAEFPVTADPNGFGQVTILFTPLPKGLQWNKFTLWEDTSGNGSFSTKVKVMNCTTPSSPPVAPADSCIAARSSLPQGGARIDLNVIGSPSDGSWAG